MAALLQLPEKSWESLNNVETTRVGVEKSLSCLLDRAAMLCHPDVERKEWGWSCVFAACISLYFSGLTEKYQINVS